MEGRKKGEEVFLRRQGHGTRTLSRVHNKGQKKPPPGRNRYFGVLGKEKEAVKEKGNTFNGEKGDASETHHVWTKMATCCEEMFSLSGGGRRKQREYASRGKKTDEVAQRNKK